MATYCRAYTTINHRLNAAALQSYKSLHRHNMQKCKSTNTKPTCLLATDQLRA